MVSVKLGSMDPDVLHYTCYMQILNRCKGLSDGKCKIRVDGPQCFTLHAYIYTFVERIRFGISQMKNKS